MTSPTIREMLTVSAFRHAKTGGTKPSPAVRAGQLLTDTNNLDEAIQQAGLMLAYLLDVQRQERASETPAETGT